ncbi:tetrahydromethanopterin S-methyltransferase, F subunit [Methanocaldococcus infernus ME]|uniref:Tetrahydromethanopterin S-methyltransferase, F subunit n=1 Tax=Methanocaldococcus infernus (strain DSM 11812 / JCM 15783 / ME) TaxID=573063 RepID=D5VQU2_METIM|nr:tetrahydromethanopterin S-methyltransferase subunit F [Methanocaldococcus infernus]ADG12945.1 tetrahydromethanopterin S-methyltransferase, F subunit [Methanocaldococcus infernus ME]
MAKIEITNKPNISSIQSYMEELEYKVGLITRNRGLESGIEHYGLKGAICGAIFALVLFGIPLILYIYLKMSGGM